MKMTQLTHVRLQCLVDWMPIQVPNHPIEVSDLHLRAWPLHLASLGFGQVSGPLGITVQDLTTLAVPLETNGAQPYVIVLWS